MSSAAAALVARRRPLFALLGFAALAVLGLAWAKWIPYGVKTAHLFSLPKAGWTHTSPFGQLGRMGTAPSVAAGWAFLTTYWLAIWKALLVALVVAAAAENFLPWRVLFGALAADRGRIGRATSGAMCAVPSMRCTCCSAPLARSLRRQGVPAGSALAFWLANPVLNPAVLVFLLLVAPWQWAAVRASIGLMLVIGAATLLPGRDDNPAVLPPTGQATTGVGFGRSLLRLVVTLLPEYALAVFAVGCFHGWLFPFGGHGPTGPAAACLAAVLGTLLVVPTGGEIAVLLALVAAGAGPWVLGPLLIAMPAVSLPSLLMVGRGFGWRLTAKTGVAVVVAALAGGGLLAVIS